MGAGAPVNNKNALKWNQQQAEEILLKAIEISKRKTEYVINGASITGFENHFIGEIATHEEIDLYSDVFVYFKNTFTELEPLYKKLKSRLEANCFSDSKKGIIKEATSIMNLKSNYGWTDRVQNTNLDIDKKSTFELFPQIDEEGD